MKMKLYEPQQQDEAFYKVMGRYFASVEVEKELEAPLHNLPNTTWCVAVHPFNQEVVYAFCSVTDKGKYYYLDNVYVVKECRNKGLCSAMTRFATGTFADKPMKAIAINERMIHLFFKFGFKEVGHNGKWKKFQKN